MSRHGTENNVIFRATVHKRKVKKGKIGIIQCNSCVANKNIAISDGTAERGAWVGEGGGKKGCKRRSHPSRDGGHHYYTPCPNTGRAGHINLRYALLSI